MADPSINDLARELAALGERMNTKQAEYKTDIATLAGATESGMERLRADMARRDADASKRETRIVLAVFAIVALATAILGFLIRLPAA